MSETKQHTPTPLMAFRAVDEAGKPLRGAHAAHYVAGCVAMGGDADFYCVARAGDGQPDICHTGNGPTSAENAAFIALACSSHDALVAALGGLLSHCDANPEGETVFEQAVIAGRAALAAASPDTQEGRQQ